MALAVVAVLMIGALGHVHLLDESMELDVSQVSKGKAKSHQ